MGSSERGGVRGLAAGDPHGVARSMASADSYRAAGELVGVSVRIAFTEGCSTRWLGWGERDPGV